MTNIINTIIGDMGEKKAYRENEKRAKALPAEYAEAYKTIKHYIFTTSGILSAEPLYALVDMLEQAALEKKRVIDITGPDVASFADELVRGTQSYIDTQRDKLNKKMGSK